jgi:hypothetical protein
MGHFYVTLSFSVTGKAAETGDEVNYNFDLNFL